MDARKKAIMVQTAPHAAIPIYEHCTCKVLLSSASAQEEVHEDDEEQFVPISDELRQKLYAHLNVYFRHMQPLSILLLHLAQRGHVTSLTAKRSRYHAPPGILQQVLANVQRAIRGNDVLLLQEHVGAALIFLDVDKQGAFNILERVYNSISLLQAETIVPPLKRETSVLLGIGTTSETDTSLDSVCESAGQVARAFHLRPIITSSSWYEEVDAQSAIVPFPTPPQRRMPHIDQELAAESKQAQPTVPFMALPAEIPPRLKHFIPHKIAVQIRCVPIGRNHHCLTVAMSNPNNIHDRQRLAELTGMTIFPIACDEDALDLLLDKAW